MHVCMTAYTNDIIDKDSYSGCEETIGHNWGLVAGVGVRGFRPPYILGCYVTSSAPHKTLKSIACGKLTLDERVALRRVSRVKQRV